MVKNVSHTFVVDVQTQLLNRAGQPDSTDLPQCTVYKESALYRQDATDAVVFAAAANDDDAGNGDGDGNG